MSRKSAIEFVKASEIDKVFLEKIKAADSPASVVNIAAEYGYYLTEQEMQAVLTGDRINWEDEELSQEQLEAVAGGLSEMLAAGSCVCNAATCVCDS